MTTSYGSNAGYIDDLYQKFLRNPKSVSAAWREFFQDFRPESLNSESPESDFDASPSHSLSGQEVGERASESPARSATSAPPQEDSAAEEQGVPLEELEEIRGATARIVENMETSLEVPTATTVRTLPVKLLEENRRLINVHQEATARPKISYTHLIAWAVVKGLVKHPTMVEGFRRADGKPQRIKRNAIHLGIAIDVERSNGQRMLYVPSIKDCGQLNFEEFVSAFNDLVSRARKGKLTLDDFSGTSVSITNPGMLGTVLSVPRLMAEQGAIIGIGSIAYPAHCSGMTPDLISQMGLSKVMTLTSTYDHRVIQGAESGAFLRSVEASLLGHENFYDEIFSELDVPHQAVDWNGSTPPTGGAPSEISAAAVQQARVLQLIRAHRERGHLMSHLDPLGKPPQAHPELELYHYGLTLWDLDRKFLADGVVPGAEVAKLRDILDVLREAYCQYATIEYMHIRDPRKRAWIQSRVENKAGETPFTIEQKLYILEKLNAAEAFEKFLGKSYIGQKRFSLEGCESLIPVLDALLEDAGNDGVDDVVIGMAHRGRLNVLVNVAGKELTQTFKEFEDIDPSSTQGSGDVKYHLGATGHYQSSSGHKVTITLASNPSHLESVDPVVEGMSRALQDQRQDRAGKTVLPVLLHGDAAFAGQGVVFETLNFSELEGYRTGGTIHIVVNNQIGFTTDPEDARSSLYATDVAKSIEAPIFHVNADHPQAAVRTIQRALAFRQEFECDVVVDLIGYRRWGHNEADEPALTQPLMYEKIRNQRSVRKLAMDRLLARGEIDVNTGEKLLEDFQGRLSTVLEEVREVKKEAPEVAPQPCLEHTEGVARGWLETGVPESKLEEILEGLTTLDSSFHPHKKLSRLLKARQEAFDKDQIDWGLAEALAFGSIVLEGTRVRLSGEDSGRGTFNQRHARIYDVTTGESVVPLQNLSDDQAPFEVYDSLLSEFGVLGFEYGYSVVSPEALVLWEAQFGDFVNGAQIIIDQYISSAEEKWDQKSSLVMLLPHGYEGQGPEHSSARLERFLQLASEGNMQIVNATTAAQYFHLLRRQVKSTEKKPLVVMTPKSLLRLSAAASAVSEFTQGSFLELIDDPAQPDPDQVTRILLCSGKVYYDLASGREKFDATGVAICRLEQFYPVPVTALSELFDRYGKATEVLWVQEEPRNMGGWDFIDERLMELLGPNQSLGYVGRPWGASPATGSHSRHEAEQSTIVEAALLKPFPEARKGRPAAQVAQ